MEGDDEWESDDGWEGDGWEDDDEWEGGHEWEGQMMDVRHKKMFKSSLIFLLHSWPG